MHYRQVLLATALLLTGARTTGHAPRTYTPSRLISNTTYASDAAPTLEEKIVTLQQQTFGSAQVVQLLIEELNEDTRFTKADKEPIYKEINEETALLEQIVPFLKKYGVDDEFTPAPLDFKNEQRRMAEYTIAKNAFDEFEKKFAQTLKDVDQMERVYALSKNMSKI